MIMKLSSLVFLSLPLGILRTCTLRIPVYSDLCGYDAVFLVSSISCSKRLVVVLPELDAFCARNI